MSTEVGAGGRFDIFLDSATTLNPLHLSTPPSPIFLKLVVFYNLRLSDPIGKISHLRPLPQLHRTSHITEAIAPIIHEREEGVRRAFFK